MNILKKQIALAAGIAMASSVTQAQIELGNGLTVTGFIDMSFVYTDVDGSSEGDEVFAIDQVETNFLYSGADGISAQVDIEYGESSSGSATDEDETFVEQAFITKQLTDQFSITGGRFLSYSGWETEEPTGLFQYSGVGYAPVFYGYYQQGVSGKFVANDIAAFTLSIVNDLYDPIDNVTEGLAVELGAHLTPAEGVTVKAFYLTEDDNDSINIWGSYETGPFTFAAEYNTREHDNFDFSTSTVTDGTDFEGDGYLLLASYAPSDFGITFRYGGWELEQDGTAFQEVTNFTIAPSYACSDNLLLVAEYKTESEDISDVDTDTFALEALFTF